MLCISRGAHLVSSEHRVSTKNILCYYLIDTFYKSKLFEDMKITIKLNIKLEVILLPDKSRDTLGCIYPLNGIHHLRLEG